MVCQGLGRHHRGPPLGIEAGVDETRVDVAGLDATDVDETGLDARRVGGWRRRT